MAILNSELDDFDVTFWLVAEDRVKDGRRVRGVPLSPKFAARQECVEASVEIKARKPDAYLVRHTYCFDMDRPEDIVERARLLDEIHGVAAFVCQSQRR
ncbi:hypothetical protein [Paraburkholderia elongata]|uniref:Uncharacterized protein n=1 Tax=Paraburkholderia elongata TaxID=2675747 RepID=A0A972NPR3_9BURK|nr:hypothetical protein [Paraburkholderia elongata]NPT57381.1 hypothetical protein [Paraburkholderia elongata]